MPFFLLGLAAKFSSVWSFIKAHAAIFLTAAFGLALLIAVLVVYDRGQSAGADKVTVQVAQQHAATVELARKDEQVAQTVSDVTGARVVAITGANHDETLAQIKEIHDELAKLQAAQPTVPIAAVPDSVRAQSNAAVASANRSADYTGPAD